MMNFLQEPLFGEAFRRDPLEAYEALRARGAFAPLSPGVWSATGYDDVSALLRERALGRGTSDPEWSEEWQARRGRAADVPPSMLFQDPPTHTRLRALVNQAFTPRAIRALEPRVRELSGALLAPHLSGGQLDLLRDYARPLPVLVIAELLGVPQADHRPFEAWATALVKGLDPVELSEDVRGEVLDAAKAFHAYFLRLIEVRRAEPRDDLLSAMIAAEEAGEKLTVPELLSMCVLLFVAGHETTMNLIGNGVLALLTHPDQLALLRDQPDLAENAVEELLRFAGPVQLTSRVVLHDLEFQGHKLRRGEQVLLFLAAANRDPARYDAPNDLNVRRADIRSLAFGNGIHYCLGAPLARLEGKVAFQHLLGRLPNVRLAGEAVWSDNITLRGLRELPLAFQANP